MTKLKIFTMLMVLPLVAACGDSADDEFIPEIPVDQFTPQGLPANFDDVVNKNPGNPNRQGDVVTFDFYETSDYHGAVAEGDKEVGISKFATYINNKRSQNPGGTVLVSGGDMWQGSADSNLTRGNLITYAMDYIGFDSMTLGNHEFDWLEAGILNNKERATFPYLAANIYDIRTGNVASFVKEYEVVNRGDYKIGIIGTIGDSVKNTILATAVANFEFKKEASIVSSLTNKLREEEQCDIVVWSTHKDVAEVKNDVSTLGANKPDLVFAAHSHANNIEFVGDTPVLETDPYGRGVAHIKVQLNANTKAVTIAQEDCEIENPKDVSGLASHEAIDAIIAQYNEKYITPVKTRKVGTFADDFSTSDLCNVAVYSMFERTKKDYSTDIEFVAALHNNNGGVRKAINKGTITYGQIYETFPFDNEVVLVPVKGRKLKGLLSNPGNMGVYHIDIDLNEVENSEVYYVLGTDFLLGDYLANYVDTSNEVVYTTTYVRDLVASTLKLEKTFKRANFYGSHFGAISY